MTINQFLVKRLVISHEAANALIAEKRVSINEVPASQKQRVAKTDSIFVNGSEVQQPVNSLYIVYYKPRGIECTLNPDILNGLSNLLPFSQHLFPVGRLDKESEGLLLLTNDGHFYNKVALDKANKEKEYIVQVDKAINYELIEQMSSGIEIMGKLTRPAKVVQIDDTTFNIILTQGLNRQIRRMCYKLDYDVVFLKRIRIMNIELGNLAPEEYQVLNIKDLINITS